MKQRLTKDLFKFSKSKLMLPISDRRRIIEIVAVVLTAIGKFVFMDTLNWRLPYVVFAITCWLTYILYRAKQDKNSLKYYGFRVDNFKETLKLMLPFGVVAIVSFFIIGYLQGSIHLTWHIIPLLITYPIWGVIQQFLTIGLIAGNLNDLKSVRLNKVYGYLYLRVKNVYAMGLFHGWLGALFYYTVLGLDPFQDIFMKYL